MSSQNESNVTNRIASAAARIADERTMDGGTVKVSELTELVAAECGLSPATARAFVSVWANDHASNGGFHVEKGQKGGVKRGPPSPREPSEEKDCCALCGTGLREVRFSALESVLNRPEHREFLKLLMAQQDSIDEEVEKIVKEKTREQKAAEKASTKSPSTPPPALSSQETAEVLAEHQ